MRIYLTGFMGAGKTTVGRILAQRLGYPYVDLDQQIEGRAGCSVREIFERDGEGAFRQLEREELARTLQLPRGVVATGGGTVAAAGNLELIHDDGICVWLNVPFNVIAARLGGRGRSDRPLFRDELQAFSLYRQRLAAYRRADLEVEVRPGESAAEVAARIILLLKERRCAI